MATGRTFIDQHQVFRSDTYNDEFTTGVNLVSASQYLQDDLNALRTQVKTLLYGTSSYAGGYWYDEPAGVANQSFARGVNGLNVGLTNIERHLFIYDLQSLAYVAVPSGSNFVALSVSGSTAPIGLAAVGLGNTPGTFTGSIVATLPPGVQAGIAHSLNFISGTSALTPRNLVCIRDAYTHKTLSDATYGGLEIYGLLQIESGALDGNTFSDSSPDRTQISFIVEYPSGTFSPASATAIGGKIINYQYRTRTTYIGLPEDAYTNTVFIDVTPIASGFATLGDITLQQAINNQGNTVVVDPYNTSINISNVGSWSYVSASTTLWQLNSTSLTTDVSNVTFNIGTTGSWNLTNGLTNFINVSDNGTSSIVFNVTNPVSFINGIAVGSGSSVVFIDASPTTDLGPTTTALVATLSGSNLVLSGGSELLFKDFYALGSSASLYPYGGIPLATTGIEWNNFVTEFGAVSILGAFLELSSSLSSSASSKRTKAVAGVIPALVTANTNVTYPTNLDAPLLSYVGKSFINDMNVYLNGVMLVNGYTAGFPNDVYPGTSAATGDLMFPYKLRSGTMISVEVF